MRITRIAMSFWVKTAQIKLSNFIIHEMLIEHQEEDIKWIFEEGINHNKSFSEFSKEQGTDKLEKIGKFFQVAIRFHPGHLQPETVIFTLRELAE